MNEILIIFPFSYSNFCSLIALNLNDYNPSKDELRLLDELDNATARNWLSYKGLVNITGYVVHRFRNVHYFLGNPTRNLELSEIDYILVSILSRGGLMYSSKTFMNASHIIEKEFNKFHGCGLSKEKNIFQKVAETVYNSVNGIPLNVILRLVRTRTYLRLRNMNKELFIELLSRNKKKTKTMCNKR